METDIFNLSDQLKPKRKHFSKRTKKAWRKHTKVQDVLNFIDEKREEDLLTLALENQDQKNTLFALDKKCTKRLKNTLPIQQRKPRTNVFHKYLQPDPISHPALRTRKEKRKVETEIQDKKVKIPKKKKLDVDGLHAPENENENENDINGELILPTHAPTYDLWGDSTSQMVNKESLLESDVLLYTKELTRQRQTEKVPDNWSLYRKVDQSEVKGLEKIKEKMAQNRLKKLKSLPSWLPAVEIPHPGTSYNPPRKAMKCLERKVKKTKDVIVKENEHVYNSLTKFIPTPEEAAKIREENEKSLAAGLDGKPEESESEAEESELDSEELAKVAHLRSLQSRDRRRLQSRRRRQAEEKQKVEKIKKKKVERRRVHEVNKIGKHLKAIKVSQANAKIRKEKTVKKEMKEMFKTKRLGKTRYNRQHVPPVENKKPKGQLRQLETGVSLMFDRFDSMLRRNLLEVRNKKTSRKKRRVKYVRKQGCKEEDIITAKLT